MLSFELALKLKEAGFPQGVHGTFLWKYDGRIREVTEHGGSLINKEELVLMPTLSELIEACGGYIILQKKDEKQWNCFWRATPIKNTVPITNSGILMDEKSEGATADEAVANLLLKLNGKAQ